MGIEADETLETAESLLDVQLGFALGGQYELWESPQGARYWVSSAWQDLGGEEAITIEEFTSPIMSWLRGASARLMQQNDQLVLHAEVDVEEPNRSEPASRWWNLFPSGSKPNAP